MYKLFHFSITNCVDFQFEDNDFLIDNSFGLAGLFAKFLK